MLSPRFIKRVFLMLLPSVLGACVSMDQPAAPIVRNNNSTTDNMSNNTQGAPAKPISAPAAATVYKPTPVAPIVNGTPTANTAVARDERPDSYTVRPGDNLFRIALNNGLGYRELAELNGIQNPADIKVGQQLKLKPRDDSAPPSAPVVASTAGNTETLKRYPQGIKLPYSAQASQQLVSLADSTATNSSSTATPPVAAKPATEAAEDKKPTLNPQTGEENVDWMWPTDGKVITPFSEKSKGIDISGSMGQPILAAADGKVVYSGSGLRGYGNLVIVKHNKTFLTAYAHNSKLLVKEGQSVKKGQKIAEMGNTDANQTKLHFEVRRFGKPVDPSQYLTKR